MWSLRSKRCWPVFDPADWSGSDIFRAWLMNDPSPGPESLEVGLFSWDEILWRELAFPSVRWALDHYRETEGRAWVRALEIRRERIN